MMKAKTIVVLVLVALFVIILIENTQVVSLRLFFWKISMSQIILIPLTILIGFVIGYIVAKVTARAPRSEKASMNSTQHEMEGQGVTRSIIEERKA
ncbi:MAG: DUF1049 domain-containing protein [Desulfobacterales bacterium]|nr:DUF1049 domain-containing protein [Desulfobacterales bacterium]